MKSRVALALFCLLAGAGCRSSSGPTSPSPLPDGSQFQIGKLFFHDLAAGDQYDIFMADLVAVSKPGVAADGARSGITPEELAGLKPRRGVLKLPRTEIEGRTLEGAILAASSLDGLPAGSTFALKNLENVTATPIADEYDPSVNSRGVIAYVEDPDGRLQDGDNTDIVTLDLAGRTKRRLTPIDGRYVEQNWDPEWKDEDTIAWVHRDRIVEASLHNLGGAAEVLPDWRWPQFDPLYSPDGTKLLFNTWVRSKKNSFWKNLETGAYKSVLPQDVFNACTDDNPAWVFSNTLIAGHALTPKDGRVYTRDIERDTFLFLTDAARDFRYVTPVAMPNEIQFIFADYADPERPRLWTCRERGEGLRPLRYTGDEALFMPLGLSAPRSGAELDAAARLYVSKFAR